MKKKRELIPPFDLNILRDHLVTLGAERLAEMVWVRAQDDDVLQKSIMVTLALQEASEDLEKAKNAIDYALHFPDFVRYSEGGHSQVLDEIKKEVADLHERGNCEVAIQITRYTITRAQDIAENFEDDWEWTCGIKSLTDFLKSISNDKNSVS